MKPKLFENDEPDSDVEIKTNNDYATHYNTWRQKEELNKLKTKYGDPADFKDLPFDNETSSSDDEDEDGRELTEEFEKDFFKTLSCLKNKDPRVYDENVVFFKEQQADENATKQKKKEKKTEPMFLKDYERKIILEKGGKFSGSEESEEENPRSNSPTYVEEQRRLRESIKKTMNDDEGEGDDWGGFLQRREKSKEEEEKEEEDYRKWLKGQKEQLDDKTEEFELKPLKDYWSNPKLDAGEVFLRDYLLNKRYLEKEDENHIPTYEEIIHDSDENLSEDEKAIEAQESFEHKYNFRYEEPDQEFIKRYPRTMDHSVRKTDDRRKMKRAELKVRKEEEKKQKQEDLKQLKALKRKEIEEKIKKLKEITGNDNMAFEDEDLDGDFDPEAHDRRMQELFNSQYYEGEEGDQKPEFSDLEEELGPWKEDGPHCEDEDFVMDCDYDPNVAKKEKKEKGKKKRNRPGKTGKDEPELDENDERYQEYMDELYKLDCEDMIGDIPCRFKYRQVVPNSFGLTIEEILLAKDRELNRWCSLKKATQHRPEHVEKYDVVAYQRKANNEALKKKILSSLYSEDLEENFRNVGKNNSEVENQDNHSFQQISEKIKNTNTEEEENNVINENNENMTKDSFQKGEGKLRKSKKENQQVNNRMGDNVTSGNKTNSESADKTPKNPKKRKHSGSESQNNLQATENQQNINEKDANKNGTSDVKVQNKKKQKKKKHSANETNLNATGTKPNSSENHTNEKITSDVKVQNNNETPKLTRRQKKNINKKSTTSQVNSEAKINSEAKQNKKNRKRKRSEQATEEHLNNVPAKKQKIKKNKKFKKKTTTKEDITISNSRLQAYGLNPKKFKNKLKYKNKEGAM